MKQKWQIDPAPPPENSASGIDVFVSLALVAFAIIGPLIYFGEDLRAVETMVVGFYGILRNWALQSETGSSELRGMLTSGQNLEVIEGFAPARVLGSLCRKIRWSAD